MCGKGTFTQIRSHILYLFHDFASLDVSAHSTLIGELISFIMLSHCILNTEIYAHLFTYHVARAE